MHKIIEVEGREIMVAKTQIIGTNFIYYSAWERSVGMHSSITHEEINGTISCWGEIKSRRLPAELDALPAMSDKRLYAVQAWRETKYQESYRMILTAFPELNTQEWKQKNGEIANY